MRITLSLFWHIIIGTIGMMVVAASIYWWTTDQTHALQLAEKELSLQNLQRENTSLTRKLRTLENQPPQIQEVIREVVVEVPVKTAPEGMREIILQVPHAVHTLECLSMGIGEWVLQPSCEQALSENIRAIYDPKKHFLVITPVVDSRAYPGPFSELKQAGLAQFRAQSAAEIAKEILSPDILILQKRPEETEDKRGFILELFAYE